MFSLPDVDECTINNGGCEQLCSNTIGSFICTCGSGYQLDENGINCNGEIQTAFDQHWKHGSVCVVLHVDINECGSDDSNSCHENAQCTNTEGSHTCTCNPGYTGDGVICASK